MDNKDTFNYTYSAKQQQEIKAIRRKYTDDDQPEDKMTRLRRLDASVNQKATVASLVLGITGALIAGFGMSLILSDLSTILNITSDLALFLGIAFGIVGAASALLAYPVYNAVRKKEREKIAPEIIRLTDELLK